MENITGFDALFIFVVIWGSLFFALWLRGRIFDWRNKRDSK